MKKERGFSMLEVLISLLVVMAGVLGIAGLQLFTLNSTSANKYQGLATQLASSVAAQMQANVAYWGVTPLAITAPAPVTCGNAACTVTISGTTQSLAQAGSSLNCITNACSGLQIAEYDEDNWRYAVQQQFPSGASLTITCQEATPVVCAINLSWSTANIALNSQDQQTFLQNATTTTSQNFQTLVTIPLAGL